MKVAILIISSLAATLAGPQYPQYNRETSVEGRQFSEDPIINYAGWGFIAGLADYFIRDLLTPTTTAAPAAAEETAGEEAAEGEEAEEGGEEGRKAGGEEEGRGGDEEGR